MSLFSRGFVRNKTSESWFYNLQYEEWEQRRQKKFNNNENAKQTFFL